MVKAKLELGALGHPIWVDWGVSTVRKEQERGGDAGRKPPEHLCAYTPPAKTPTTKQASQAPVLTQMAGVCSVGSPHISPPPLTACGTGPPCAFHGARGRVIPGQGAPLLFPPWVQLPCLVAKGS